jgi:hypothetical protein
MPSAPQDTCNANASFDFTGSHRAAVHKELAEAEAIVDKRLSDGRSLADAVLGGGPLTDLEDLREFKEQAGMARNVLTGVCVWGGGGVDWLVGGIAAVLQGYKGAD